MRATQTGDLEKVKYLLSKDGNTLMQGSEDMAGNSPVIISLFFVEVTALQLHIAAARNDLECVKLLLDMGQADVSTSFPKKLIHFFPLSQVFSVNSMGLSPLLYAVREGKPAVETLKPIIDRMREERMRACMATMSRST